jgi:hypothetical protein
VQNSGQQILGKHDGWGLIVDVVRVLGSLISSLSAIPKKNKAKMTFSPILHFTTHSIKSTKFIHQY